MVADQLQEFLNDVDYLDSFQSGFRPVYGNEIALVILVDDLCQKMDKRSATLLILLDLLVAFDAIHHGILLDYLSRLSLTWRPTSTVGFRLWCWKAAALSQLLAYIGSCKILQCLHVFQHICKTDRRHHTDI